jgi:PhoH-like ATPase
MTTTFRPKRVFVLDTNVLLHDSASIFAFKGVTVVIPFVVLEELDTFKKNNTEIGRNARAVIRMLDEFRSQGSLSEGVEINHNTGSRIKVIPTPEKLTSPSLCSAIRDNAIIQTAQNLNNEGFKVTLVTKDINARVKSDSLNLDSEDYMAGVVEEETFYKGWIRVSIPAVTLKAATSQKLVEIVQEKQLELNPNEFIILQSENNSENNKIFRFLGGTNFKQIHSPKLKWNFAAKNIEQLMALDLLLDDSISLVSLLGPAGTGKTFLALLAGLQKVINERVYRKLLVTRPVVALGGDIGYLPGDMQEKLHNWMKPIHDNLEFIFSENKNSSESKEDNLGSRAKERRYQRRHPSSSDDSKEVELLQNRGILSIEAITYMRGRSIPNQFIFIDEVQNLTPHEVKTIVSRAGEGSKVVLAGDPHQIDSPYLDFISNGLTITAEKFKEQPIAGTVYLEKSERSRLAEIAARIL